MTAGQQDQPVTQGEGKARPKRSRSLAAHRAFAPMLGIWGAALAGLSVIVLPARMFAAAGRQAGLMLPAMAVQAALAVMAALVLGGVLYRVARGMGSKSRLAASEAPSIISAATRRLRTIDPQRDLGSASLDAPVTIMPFGARFGGDEIVVPIVDLPPEPPRSLDLAEFAEFPGRNAVWVEEAPAAIAAQEAARQEQDAPGEMIANDPDSVGNHIDEAACQPSPLAPAAEPQIPHPGAAALAQLRAKPPEQLSLIQMVERFAGALHEHRAAPPGKAITGQDIAGREAALAEALRALAALSGESNGPAAPTATDEPLRDALSRLQGIRGAA